MNILKWAIGGFFFYEFFLKEESSIVGQSVNVIQENDAFNINKDDGLHGGNPLAKNIKGQGKFNYLNTVQLRGRYIQDKNENVFPLENKKGDPWGIECKFVSVINLYKSLGLLEPAYTANQFEEEFTNIFNENGFRKQRKPIKKYGYEISSILNHDLRGREEITKPQRRLTGLDYIDIANNLARVCPHARKTGMNNKRFKFVNLFDKELKTLKKHLENGGVACSFLFPAYDKGHYITVHRIDGNILYCDDPLRDIARWNFQDKTYETNLIQTAWTLQAI